MTSKAVSWWQKAIIYQIYPLSFCDSDGDGFGDLKGITSKLNYLKDLGVDVLWLSPIYKSPMDDNGYDISDYDSIDPIFGTMDDFNELLEAVHSRNQRLIMDLVINHTSDEHLWFLEARKSKDNPYRDFYIWRDEPSDITSVFSGSAWELDPLTNQYYFHLFSKKQPDLNWDNPLLRQEIYKMINRWLDLGIDGFRLDVIDLIGKDVEHKQLGDGPFLNERLDELNKACFEGRDIMTVGEMPGVSIKRTIDITDLKHSKLNMVFQFGHLWLDEMPGEGKWALKPLDLLEFKRFFKNIQNGLYQKGWNSLFLSNHDQPRAVSRYGNLIYRKESAKMLATMIYSMQGTPYVYQGEELGMTGIKLRNIGDYRDIETLNMYKEYLDKGWPIEKVMASIYAKGRDNSRTPMQWNASMNAGFSKGKPWLKVNPNYRQINTELDRVDHTGVYRYFKRLFELRKRLPIFDSGDFTLIEEENRDHFSYVRKSGDESIVVICSFKDQPIELDLSQYQNHVCLLSNYPSVALTDKTQLDPYYAGIYYAGQMKL